MTAVTTGLDELRAGNFAELRGKRVALLCNQASIARDLEHAVDIFCAGASNHGFTLKAVLGPQHGLYGHTQDNMIEWQDYRDPRTGLPVYSLYGTHRKPTPEMLEGVDTLVVDLQDVGAKYYTFIWTLAHCMEACAAAGIEVVVLDRPNPIGGIQLEGPFAHGSFRSFVGWHDLAIRHGMTIGEIARYFHQRYYPGCALQVIPMQNWRREMYFEQTGLPWAMPSPNIPCPESTVVYPGMCLFEATNLSEGRGTTRPFEIFGADFIDGWELRSLLEEYRLPGVFFRALEFQPTFHKHAGKVCGGCFIHVTDRKAFRPFLTGIAILHAVIGRYPEHFAWNPPPYEYEYEKRPFDILVGNDWIRPELETQRPLPEIEEQWQRETEQFAGMREAFLLYR